MNIFSGVHKILLLIFPPKCYFCNAPIEITSGKICLKCKEELPVVKNIKIMHSDGYTLIAAPFYYTGCIKTAIKNFKFNNKPHYALLFSSFIKNGLANRVELNEIEAIVPVPMHYYKKFKRGYNQAELIAKELSKSLNIPVINALRVQKYTKTQHFLNAQDRAKNIKGAYSLRDNKVRGKTVLLVDDIITTGITVKECSRVLNENGVKKVYCTTFAISGKH